MIGDLAPSCDACMGRARVKVTAIWLPLSTRSFYACDEHRVQVNRYLRGLKLDGQEPDRMLEQYVMVTPLRE